MYDADLSVSVASLISSSITSAGGRLVPQGIICPVVSALARTVFDDHPQIS